MPTKPTKHLTRRELKQDDQIHATLTKFSSLLAGRMGILVGAGIGLLVLAAAVVLWQTYGRSQDEKAQKVYGEALETFHAPVAEAPVAGAPETFKTEAERAKKALEKFTQVEQQYSSRPVGKLAQYYTALSQRQLKNDKEAIRILQALEADSPDDVKALARQSLAEIYRSSGMNDQAMQTYQLMLKDTDSRFPKDAILASMGQLAENMGRGSEATGYYQRLTREHAQSPFVAEANARLAALTPTQK